MTATVQGKKLDITAGSVSELQESIASQQGLRADRQAVFFKGKKLAAGDSLAAAGVQDGDQITVTQVRGSVAAQSRVASRADSDGDDVDRGLDELDAMPAGAGGGGGPPAGLGGAGDMMQSMFGGAQQKEVLEALSDPKKLEESRQQLLQHPMFKQMAASVPGLAEAVKDPAKWKETMEQARSMMDQVSQGGPQAAEVKQAMEQGMKMWQQGNQATGGLDALLGSAPKDGVAAKAGIDVAAVSRAFGHEMGSQVVELGLSMADAARGMALAARKMPSPMKSDAYEKEMSRLRAAAKKVP